LGSETPRSLDPARTSRRDRMPARCHVAETTMISDRSLGEQCLAHDRAMRRKRIGAMANHLNEALKPGGLARSGRLRGPGREELQEFSEIGIGSPFTI
jgi:hypothetical protein